MNRRQLLKGAGISLVAASLPALPAIVAPRFQGCMGSTVLYSSVPLRVGVVFSIESLGIVGVVEEILSSEYYRVSSPMPLTFAT